MCRALLSVQNRTTTKTKTNPRYLLWLGRRQLPVTLKPKSAFNYIIHHFFENVKSLSVKIRKKSQDFSSSFIESFTRQGGKLSLKTAERC